MWTYEVFLNTKVARSTNRIIYAVGGIQLRYTDGGMTIYTKFISIQQNVFVNNFTQQSK